MAEHADSITTPIATYPAARSVRHALGVLCRLPAEALADLAERLIDRLDELEPETDACEAAECGGRVSNGDGHVGDADDAEPDDDGEFDDHPALDIHSDDDVPCFPERLRSARDGLVQVKRQIVQAVLHRKGRPALVQRMRYIRWEARR